MPTKTLFSDIFVLMEGHFSSVGGVVLNKHYRLINKVILSVGQQLVTQPACATTAAGKLDQRLSFTVPVCMLARHARVCTSLPESL